MRCDASGVTFLANFCVCDVPFCIVSLARMLLQDFCAMMCEGCVGKQAFMRIKGVIVLGSWEVVPDSVG